MFVEVAYDLSHEGGLSSTGRSCPKHDAVLPDNAEVDLVVQSPVRMSPAVTDPEQRRACCGGSPSA